MKALLGLLAAALLAPAAFAQALVPVSGNGAMVATGAVTNRIVIEVRDSGGNPRPGVPVTFESACMDRVRGEGGAYPCVTALVGEPLVVVSNVQGQASSPLYQAETNEGNAWVSALAVVDGRQLRVSFYWQVGASPLPPIRVVSGSNQTTQVNFPIALPLRAQVVDWAGRPVPNVPVTFTSNCTALPCLKPPAVNTLIVSDAMGYVSTGIRTVNDIAGTYTVTLGATGATRTVGFSLTNVRPVRSKSVNSLIGMGSIFLEMKEAPVTCSMTTMEPVPDTQMPKPPSLVAAPRGRLRVVFENCTAGATIKLSLQHADGMPESSRVWQAAPEWMPLDSTNTIEGFWEFALVDGGKGDPDGKADGRIETVLAVAFGDPAAPNFQDLWWVGQVENGWGMSVVQHGLSLFVVVFAYDASGEPTWYVMPGGSWNATAGYSGALYSPRGRPINQHVSSNLVVGAPVGSATIEFADVMSARLILRINGRETVKYIQRQMFGAREARVLPSLEDMWWAGSGRSGWGLVLQQQRASLFGLLFTYRSDGMPTWFAMPTGLWTADDTYEGLVYRTRSSAWPDPYDASKLVTSTLGAFKLRFTNGNVNASFDFSAEGTASSHTLSRQPF